MSATLFNPTTFDPEPGITLIEASAGTGKTHNITHTVVKLIGNGSCNVSEILVLTFTEAATQELRERIRGKLADELDKSTRQGDERVLRRYSEALDDFDRASIYTIHGFCNRILREYSVEADLGAEFAVLKNDSDFIDDLVVEIARDFQVFGEKNPWMAMGLRALGVSSKTIRRMIGLKDSGVQTSDSSRDIETWFTEEARQLKRLWIDDGETIRKDLLDSQAPIKRQRKVYKVDFLAEALDEVEHALLAEEPSPRLFEILGALSECQLNSVLKKNAVLNSTSFYRYCDQTLKKLDQLAERITQRALFRKSQRVADLIFKEQKLRFDDLLTATRDLICGSDEKYAARINNSYRYALIDEFQDTDPVQYAILERLFVNPPTNSNRKPLILIGDPKQAIYGFRGGDIFTYNKARQAAQAVYFLDTNWRSTPGINGAVNALLGRLEAPFGFSWIDYQQVESAEKNRDNALVHKNPDGSWKRGSGIRWTIWNSEDGADANVAQTVERIADLLRGGTLLELHGGTRALKPDDIAVLVPDNKKAAIVHEALGASGISASISGGASVFQSKEALYFYTILCAVENPRNTAVIRAACSTSFFHSSLLFSEGEVNDEINTTIVQHFIDAQKIWRSRGLAACLNHLEKSFDWRINLSNTHSAQRALANQQHLVNLLLSQEQQVPGNPHLLISWLRENINDPDRNDADQLLHLDSSAQAVKITTMHKSKGLDFPIVILPFLPEPKTPSKTAFPRQFHDTRTGELVTVYSETAMSFSSEPSALKKELASEALRTLYVALTRAEVFCEVFVDLSVVSSGKSILCEWLPTTGDPANYLEYLNQEAFQESAAAREQRHSPEAVFSDQGLTVVAPPAPPNPPASLQNLSFTGIVHRSHNELTTRTDDEPVIFSSGRAFPKPVKQASLSLFDFDRGTQAGLMFHEILERVDFSHASSWRPLIAQTLIRFGYADQPWIDPIEQTLNVLSKQRLGASPSGTFRLADISPQKLFRESEFSYSIDWSNSTIDSLEKLFAHSKWTENQKIVFPGAVALQKVADALMNGIIDCWCLHGEKVYLIDWKSNHMGDKFADYEQAALSQAMSEHHYHLQYLLYICAINRYMRLIQPRYSYDQHFGGVGYCFLRGIHPENPGDGWYWAYPPAEFIDALEKTLKT
jgi:exodeoxyribonuclease V beta subunit